MISSKELTIRQIGEWCTNTHCHKCPIKKWNDESGLHNDCMESLRLPQVAEIMLKQIRAEAIKELRAELIESDLVTFSQVIDFLSDKLKQLKEQNNETEQMASK